MFKKYLLAWFPMVLLAILNGVIREATYGQMVSHDLAHQISTVTLILAFSVYVWFLGRIWPLASLRQAALVGTVWLALTVAFEFAMGRFISGLSWEEMFRAYDLLSGNLWILVPLAVALLPSLMFLTGRKTA
ncbi:MAG: hypothetical protein EA363_00765 [Balneolaceae bacterium]|nr:MAG: hypothetical protein EA363_00765 [Balneolaceae bacterium]